MADSAAPSALDIFAKTGLGHAEIHQRALRLPLLMRRVLLLVDGRRTVAELAPFAGDDVAAVLDELLGRGCIERVGSAPTPARRREEPPAVEAPEGQGTPGAHGVLPAPQSRTPEQVDMARHFMINTINRLLEQNSRLTLVEKIFHAADAAELRTHYPAWEEAIASAWMGRKRLDELRTKLFAVL